MELRSISPRTVLASVNAIADSAAASPGAVPPGPTPCDLELGKIATFHPQGTLIAPGECGAPDGVLLESVTMPERERASAEAWDSRLAVNSLSSRGWSLWQDLECYERLGVERVGVCPVLEVEPLAEVESLLVSTEPSLDVSILEDAVGGIVSVQFGCTKSN